MSKTDSTIRFKATLVLALWVCVSTPARAADQLAEPQTVLFVCEHGSVKSLLAKLLFEQAAVREDLAVSAASRGTAPDVEVPDWMRTALERDGFPIGPWKPTALSEADIRGASLVVTFDVLVPSKVDTEIERWDGLPAVSKDYVAGREAIAARIEKLVAELKRAAEAGRLR
jgi:protein-tyrosine-phosphatase